MKRLLFVLVIFLGFSQAWADEGQWGALLNFGAVNPTSPYVISSDYPVGISNEMGLEYLAPDSEISIYLHSMLVPSQTDTTYKIMSIAPLFGVGWNIKLSDNVNLTTSVGFGVAFSKWDILMSGTTHDVHNGVELAVDPRIDLLCFRNHDTAINFGCDYFLLGPESDWGSESMGQIGLHLGLEFF